MDWPTLKQKLMTPFQNIVSETRSWNMIRANANITFVGQLFCFTKEAVMATEGYGEKSYRHLEWSLTTLGLGPRLPESTPFQIATYDWLHKAQFDESLPLYTRNPVIFSDFLEQHKAYFLEVVKPYGHSKEGLSLNPHWLKAHVPTHMQGRVSEEILKSVLNDAAVQRDVQAVLQQAIIRKISGP